MPERKEGWKSLTAGAVAGAVDTCITMPLDTAKTQMQLNHYKNLVQCAKQIVAANGIGGLYFGFGPFLLQTSGKAAVRFFAYDTLTNLYRASGIFPENSVIQSVSCGIGAGMTEALVWTTPTERLKILRQAKASELKGSNRVPPPSALEIFRTQGIAGLYVGAIPTAARQASSVAIRFTFVDWMKNLYKAEKSTPTPLLSFLAGGLAGAISVIFNNPIDVVKSKIQAGFKGSLWSCVVDIQTKRGWRAWGAGLSARVPRLFISQAVQFTVFEQVIFFLDPPKKDDQKNKKEGP